MSGIQIGGGGSGSGGGGGAVNSVNGKTGTVVLVPSDIGALGSAAAGASGSPAAFAPGTRQLVYEGDSHSTTGSTYPGLLTGLFAPAPTVSNVATGGQTLETMVPDAYSQVDSLFNPTLAGNILSLWAGTNSMKSAGTLAAQVYADLVYYCNARRAAGWTVLVYTAMPRNDGGGALTGAAYETQRLAFNTLVRANWASFADALADVALNAAFDAFGDEANATYYQGDLVHLTVAGYTIVAGIAYAALNAIGIS